MAQVGEHGAHPGFIKTFWDSWHESRGWASWKDSLGLPPPMAAGKPLPHASGSNINHCTKSLLLQ